MRNYNITVNGKVYSVSVEDTAQAVQAARPAQAAHSTAATIPNKEVGPETIVTSPIAGTVTAVKIKAGDKVKEGDIMLLIASAASETEILSPFNASAVKICVAVGGKVNTGDSLVVF